MAKPGISEEPEPTLRAAELKSELRRLVRGIVEDQDGCGAGAYDRAREVIEGLKACRFKEGEREVEVSSAKMDALEIPKEFLCPVSKELMRDPVVLATGQTYDRQFIQAKLDAGLRMCPQTQQVLSNTDLIPNNLVREMITQWCQSKGIQPKAKDSASQEKGITKEDKERFKSLLKEVVSAPLAQQKVAAKELRSLTKRIPSFRSLFSERRGSIDDVIAPLKMGEKHCPPDLREDLVTTVMNLSIPDENKRLIAQTEGALRMLIDALDKNVTIETRANAAAALFTLSAVDENKSDIGLLGALKPLIELLSEGHPLAMKDAASAIYSLCISGENKRRAVRDGAIRVIMEKLVNRTLIAELLAILAMLSNHQNALEELVRLGAVPCLLGIMRESDCKRNKENCIAILYSICQIDKSKLKEVLEEERVNHSISQLTENGTSRAKRKASGILDRLIKTGLLTHTA